MPSASSAFAKSGRPRIVRSDATHRTWRGVVFDSMLEMELYVWMHDTLQMPEACMRRQVAYELLPPLRIKDASGTVEKVRATTYVADLVLSDPGKVLPDIVIDFKGWSTPEFKLKRKMFMARHGLFLHCVKTKAGIIDILKGSGWTAKTRCRQ